MTEEKKDQGKQEVPNPLARDSDFPAWFYGPNGESDIFHHPKDVPADWSDTPFEAEEVEYNRLKAELEKNGVQVQDSMKLPTLRKKVAEMREEKRNAAKE